ncbi:MAG: PQQ-binding-like beta-propeller repeat protein [Halobacteriales archaeon]
MPTRREWLAYAAGFGSAGTITAYDIATSYSLSGALRLGLRRWQRRPPTAPMPDDPAGVPTFRGGIRRRGYLPSGTVPSSVVLDWKRPGLNKWTHTAAKGSPVVSSDGTILIGGDTGVLWAFDLDGSIKWTAVTHPSENGIHGTPVVVDGRVYVGAYDGAMYAFGLDDGRELWRTRIGESIGASPLYYNDRLYIAVETTWPSGILAALDPATGEVVFEDPGIGDHPHSSPAIAPDHDRLVVGANDGVLYGWTLSSETRAWTFETGGAIKGPIAIDGDAAVFGSWDGRVYAVDLASGEQRWSFPTDGKVMSGPAIHPDSGTVYVGSHDTTLYALAGTDGTERWRASTNGTITGCPTICDGTVLIGSYDGHLYAFEADSGDLRWRFAANGHVTATPTVVGNRILIADRATREQTGAVYALGPTA